MDRLDCSLLDSVERDAKRDASGHFPYFFYQGNPSIISTDFRRKKNPDIICDYTIHTRDKKDGFLKKNNNCVYEAWIFVISFLVEYIVLF